MKVSDIGEFGLISRIKDWVNSNNPNVICGIGDDTAVIELDALRYLLFTCDVQVEGIHFSTAYMFPRCLGKKSLAINVSDIASMGGLPTYSLISLLIPQNLEVNFLQELYEGFTLACREWNLTIVGGNISSTDGPFTIDISLLGEVKKENLKLRSKAQAGDQILLTGYPGRSAAGLKLLQNNIATGFSELVEAHLSPVPRLAEASLIATYPQVSAMIDVSDGVLQDLSHILEDSQKGAVLLEDSFPLAESLLKAGDLLQQDPFKWFLGGGEDYELLFTAAPQVVPFIKAEVEKKLGTRVSLIGEINDKAKEITLNTIKGKSVSLTALGWDHFR